MVVPEVRVGDGVPGDGVSGWAPASGPAPAAGVCGAPPVTAWASSWMASPDPETGERESELGGMSTTAPHWGHLARFPPAASGAEIARRHAGHMVAIGMDLVPPPGQHTYSTPNRRECNHRMPNRIGRPLRRSPARIARRRSGVSGGGGGNPARPAQSEGRKPPRRRPPASGSILRGGFSCWTATRPRPPPRPPRPQASGASRRSSSPACGPRR